MMNTINMLDETLPFNVRMKEALGWMAALATKLPFEQREYASKYFQKLLAAVGDMEIEVRIPAVTVLCHAIDRLRDLKMTEEVQVTEELIQALKGNRQRVITGSFQMTPQNLAQLDDTLENLRKNIVAAQPHR